MFKMAELRFSEPICLCLENKLSWTVDQGKDGPELRVWCAECGVKVVVPRSAFVAKFTFDVGYPGKPAAKPKEKPKMEVVTPKPGDVLDISEYIRRKRENEPPS